MSFYVTQLKMDANTIADRIKFPPKKIKDFEIKFRNFLGNSQILKVISKILYKKQISWAAMLKFC